MTGIKQMEKEPKVTKIALAEKTMALDAMEAIVEIANKHYQIDFKKKFRAEAITFFHFSNITNFCNLCHDSTSL
jgi:hypothetical protein